MSISAILTGILIFAFLAGGLYYGVGKMSDTPSHNRKTA
jgi:hypothetical protein